MGSSIDLTKQRDKLIRQTSKDAGVSVDEALVLLTEASDARFQADYREYAMSVIRDRSIPDVRDGLKPVHRRILYAMNKIGCRSDKKVVKSARIVGDVIGKYHPHGDTAAYEAMVRMAQYWNVRYMPVFGQGNFGSIDGDSPAAMRYSEAKISEIGELLLGKALGRDGVDFVLNYDGSFTEPRVLPAELPFLAINGGEGIAVAIASSFLPHNMTEVLNACKAILKKRRGSYKTTSVDALILKYIQGPDFPTGGIVVSPEGALESAYKTGRGKVIVRSRYHVEKVGKKDWQLVVTELPPSVAKDALIMTLSDALFPEPVTQVKKGKDKKDEKKKVSRVSGGLKNLPLLLVSIDDESAKRDIRIVIKPKNMDLDPDALMMHLYAVSRLSETASINMNALIDHGDRPKCVSLGEALERFLDFRENTIIRESKYLLDKIEQRLHILEGLLIAVGSIDEIVLIIRREDDPESVLMGRFSLSLKQVEAIVEIRLKTLKKIGVAALSKEVSGLSADQSHLTSVLTDDDFRSDMMIERFDDLNKKFGDKRRSTIHRGSTASRLLDPSSIMSKDHITIVLTAKGWIKSLKGKDADTSKTKLLEGDEVAHVLSCMSNEVVAFVTADGKSYSMLAGNLPSGRTEGKALGTFFAISSKVASIFIIDESAKYFVSSTTGLSFVADGSGFVASTNKGKQLLVGAGEVIFIKKIEDGDSHVFFYTANGKCGLVDIASFPCMAKGKGVKSLSMDKGDGTDYIFTTSLTEEGGQCRVTGDKLSPLVVARGRKGAKLDKRIAIRYRRVIDSQC